MVRCCHGFRTWSGLFLGAAVGFIGVNVLVSNRGDDGSIPQEEMDSNRESKTEVEKSLSLSKTVAPGQACLALIGAQNNLEDIPIRVQHLSKMQHYDFARRYLVLDLKGGQIAPQIRALADSLVSNNAVDQWMTVDHSQSYLLRLNQTAEWDLGSSHQSTAHGVSFDDAQTLDTQLAFYFAIDQCFAEFIAIFQLDQIMYSAANVSWIQDAIPVLRKNEDLILVSLPFPGFADRKLRQRPTTRPIPKLNSGHLKGYPEVEDTTCQHPYSLAGRATLLDIQRYRQLPPRNHVNEHRCGGQLVRGKPCRSLPFVRSCGGMRTWEAALECVICNSEQLQQGSLTNWKRTWSQHAPMTSVRHDLARLKADIEIIEGGEKPSMGPEYRGLEDLMIAT